MNDYSTLDSITDLICKASESQFLEFKRGQALDDIEKSQTKEEVVRDVNAFANAGGGTIIYGLEENKNTSPSLASELSPVLNEKADVLRLTSIIRSGMEPVFNAFSVSEIAVQTGGRIIVVNIEKAETAHQCKSDHKYYQRVGPGRLPMYDHQIRDVMNRRASPVVRLQARLHTIQQDVNAHVYDLRVELVNEGQRTANLWAVEIALPPGLSIENPGSWIHERPNRTSYRSHRVWEYSCERNSTGNRALLLPSQTHALSSDNGYAQILLKVTQTNYPQIEREQSPIVFRLYVDDCSMQSSNIPFAEWCKF